MKTAQDFRLLFARLKDDELKCDCNHIIKITKDGIGDTIVIWQIGKNIKLL